LKRMSQSLWDRKPATAHSPFDELGGDRSSPAFSCCEE
jgi:hypothetical protein